MQFCQDRNSSAFTAYRLQTSSNGNNPPRTAATTSALRRIIQRLVSGSGKSAMVKGHPSSPMTFDDPLRRFIHCHRRPRTFKQIDKLNSLATPHNLNDSHSIAAVAG
jgi:hypothetical protein